MGGYVAFTATSTSGTATATREIISTTLIDDTLNTSSRYTGTWVYGAPGGSSVVHLGVQRQIRLNGYDGTTGTLYTSSVFSAAPLTGHKWELYYRIPAIKDVFSGRDGYREIINEALRLMTVPDVINITGVTNQTKYTLDLTTYPWLREPGHIVNVKRPTPNTNDLERIDAQEWHLIPDGEALILQLPSAYASTDTFKLEVRRPANSRLKQSGTWTDQATLAAGLTLDADEAIPSINDVVAVARELCFYELASVGPAAMTEFWEAKAQDAARSAATLKFVRQPPTEPYHPLRLSGVGDLGAFR